MAEAHPRWVFARTTAFRVTLLHLLLTLAGTSLVGGVAWWSTAGFAARQAAQEIERGMGVLLQSGAMSGPRGIALSIEARLAADRSGVEFYLLAAPDGQRIAGNLSGVPQGPGWHEGTARLAEGAEAPVMMLATPLPGGGALVVGRDLSAVRALEQRLLSGAMWVGGAVLLLGLAGGLLIGRGVAKRAAAMEAALAAVQAGALDRRLAVGSGGDEFDRLAARINATLDRLQSLMAALREVTDDIAHDLRTPLTRLRQRLDTAAQAPTPAAIAAAQGEADALLDIFAALLRIAQVESGTQRAGFTRVDLSAIAESVAEVYAPAAEERGQTLATDIAPGVTLTGDPALLTQMLANLVENAVRHGREAGRVALAVTGEGVTVTDDGPGIPQAERERVFRRFHRLDAARSTPGSGLGLALVRAVAELHGMSVMLEDASPGLRVRVWLHGEPGIRAN
ncbi:HAMP domain-containing histidine kinase [Roseomonas eburnea]|uniref:histidine kinase n=1 Tax=Neoroseomonas eburnea TaxID=1346889 RepID=A0A9X9XJX4_9PROT|nr:HAMP domain-containing sensor histidine kinase [Neoroseomonas eburnea]MBR0684010.1 HAMP domain-containing histidine kinase [Neoroseomonas eburnea]